MKNKNLTSIFRSLNQVIMVLFLFASPLAGVYAACCAGHGGVASCNKSTGHQMCKDGTASPTCTCAVPKTKKASTSATAPATSTIPKTMTKTTPTTTKSTTTTTTKPKSSWWGGKKSTTTTPSTTTKSTPASSTSAKGCCSRHGGVAQCDKASGHQMCKDGTASPSCTCQ